MISSMSCHMMFLTEHDLFDLLSRYYLSNRYPDYIDDLLQQTNEDNSKIILEQTNEVFAWLLTIEAVRREAVRYADEVRRKLPVDKAFLFGSYAKGTADELSDVDVAFFIKDWGGKTRFEIGVELLRLTHNYTAYLKPLVFSSSEIARNNPFVNGILNTGQEI